MTRIALSKITADQTAQPRVAIEVDKVGEYAEDMQRGDKFPSPVVFFDGKQHWLADGFHRYYAATSAELDELEFDVRKGTLRDAILFSCGANAAHGLRRTNDDKKRAVMKLLHDTEWASWADREIARHCAVADTFVAKVRKEFNALDDTAVNRSMKRTFTHPKTGQPATMTFAGRDSQPGALIAKSLHEIERHIDMMPPPAKAVAAFPKDERYFFPVSRLDEMAAWMTEFAQEWRAKIAGKVA